MLPKSINNQKYLEERMGPSNWCCPYAVQLSVDVYIHLCMIALSKKGFEILDKLENLF